MAYPVMAYVGMAYTVMAIVVVAETVMVHAQCEVSQSTNLHAFDGQLWPM